MTHEEIRQFLQAHAEPAYREFSARLLPSGTPLLGVRLPVIRGMAKELARGDWRAYLDTAWDDLFEERMLQGMTLGVARASAAEKVPYLDRYLPKVNNWSLCDSLCASLKTAKAEPEAMLAYIDRCIGSPQPYRARFAVVQLLMYYMREETLEDTLSRLNRVVAAEPAAQVAIAWAVSVAYRKAPERTLQFLDTCALSPQTKRCAYQKMLEMTGRSEAEKARLRALRNACRSVV